MSNPEEVAQELERVRGLLAQAAGTIVAAQVELHESWQIHGALSGGAKDEAYLTGIGRTREAHQQLGEQAVPCIGQAEQLIAGYIASIVGSAASGGIDTTHQPLPPLSSFSDKTAHQKSSASTPQPSSDSPSSTPGNSSSGKTDKKQQRIEASSEADINAQVIKDIASEFGDLTAESEARLPQSEEVSATRLSLRRDSVESVTYEQTHKLFEAMDTVIANSPGLQGVPREEILANSYGIGRSFGLLANAERKPHGLNEVTTIRAMQDNPADWFQADPHNQRLVLTAQARERLQAAYIPEGGCPAIGLRVTNDGGGTSSDLFVLYWGMLARG